MTWVTWVCTARGGGAGGAGGGHYSQQDGRKEQERGAVLAPCQCLSPCLSLVTLPLRREGEREVGRLLELDTSSTSLLDISRGEDLDTSGSTSLLDCSIFSYASPDMLRTVRRRSPRVDLFKLRLDFL